MGLCCQLHPLPFHEVINFLAHCSFSPCYIPHVLLEYCGLELSGQGQPPTITRVQRTTAASSAVPMSMATFLGTTWCAGMTIASSSIGKDSHLLGNLVLQCSCSIHCFGVHHGPHCYPVMGLLIFALHLSGSCYGLGIQYARGVV